MLSPYFSPIFASKANFPSKTFKSFSLFLFPTCQVFAHLELCESNQIAKERLEAIEDHLRSLLEAMGEEERERVAREAERGDPRTGRTAAEVNERVPALGRMPVVIDTNVRIPAIAGWANGRLTTGANGTAGKAIGTNGNTGKATGATRPNGPTGATGANGKGPGTTGNAAGATAGPTGKAVGATPGTTGKAAGATAGTTGKASGATVASGSNGGTSGANGRDTKATQTTECAIGRRALGPREIFLKPLAPLGPMVQLVTLGPTVLAEPTEEPAAPTAPTEPAARLAETGPITGGPTGARKRRRERRKSSNQQNTFY